MESIHVVFTLIVVVPLFFWYRVWAINKRKNSVTVECPHCGRDQRLAKLQNYNCVKCETRVVFFDERGEPLKTLEVYKCQACGTANFKGIITCVGCGLANRKAI